ncbi:3-octaprenyl-4-hydroxybenzoate decarboxylase [Aliiruegeria haliotis]|uniref:Flavin prenyltransferase UbiX n=1 Tax=Aliiruegeria haliotis TaxID=1280846 RepID=A0A2T0RUF3_9RHOB|nr:UbiX family flavin prenyltransferase [Aliiruegeria haliotis]PRY24836.1 3-octaprenyl-4-hydroxybenzoate decarboxylase [Aliiruegeria haliotis]
MKRIIVGIAGASGVIYGIRLLEVLKAIGGYEVHLVMSRYARMNIEIETDFTAKYVEDLADVVHNSGNQAAAISSGSFQTEGMIVTACSMRTLSAITHSMTDNLVTRAADVVLKEKRRLVLMPREAPLHVGHCKLLFEAAQLGAIIAPPMPAFYNRPKTIDDIVNHGVGRVLDLFDIDAGLLKRWEGPYPHFEGSKLSQPEAATGKPVSEDQSSPQHPKATTDT